MSKERARSEIKWVAIVGCFLMGVTFALSSVFSPMIIDIFGQVTVEYTIVAFWGAGIGLLISKIFDLAILAESKGKEVEIRHEP